MNEYCRYVFVSLSFFIALTVLYLMRIAYPFSYLFFMTQQELTEEEALLICWMRKKRVQAAEIMVMARLLRGVSTGMSGRLQCVELGIKEWKAMKKTVSFSVCVAESLKARAHRRRRTLEEIRCVTARMVKSWPELRHKMMRGLRREDCQRILNIFPTASGRRKARVILHGICAFACRRGWAGKNPAAETPCPLVKERRVPVLTPEECRKLMTAAREVCGGECLPAAVLMLYAGVRPQEVRRLQFRHIRLEEKAALIPARHSKTGGARRVTLRPVALQYLRAFRNHSGEEPLCPAGWERKWRLVRARAGWNNCRPWVQDILRHTFASYHALEFRDYAGLQWEMGHQNAHLLKTRYLNMDEIRRQDARAFWLAA